ncbi:MAG TPA: phospho-N-acetylmuramoyl-pentapeptide-transferase [Chloroflexota bacterium]|nr:phospho-N-acetylmuramoyl-pentapeptide-transferase [Chloroflexota bacterium]
MPTAPIAFALVVGVFTFLVGLLIGRPIVIGLAKLGVGKAINPWGPESHRVKSGTPTMGGVLIVLSVLAVTLAVNLSIGGLSILLPLGVIVAAALLGAYDDYLTLVGRKSEGLSPRTKMAGLLLIAAVAAWVLYDELGLRGVYRPGSRELIDFGLWYLPIAMFVIVGTANAVNITDGVDGLAAKLLAIAFFAYGFISLLQGQVFLMTLAFTVVGAVLAFLWYNAHPAEVFMGDTGSLALGAALAVVALMTSQWLLLPVVGIIFVVETASVIIQKGYRRLNHDKRLFRMAPIHHHFELSGWAETQVSDRFWVLGLLGAMLGIALALL